MNIRGKKISLIKVVCLILYYGFARFLPSSGKCLNIGRHARYFLCKKIFKKCGKNVNVERKAWFASGVDVEIGDYSGIGINCHIPNGTVIGDYVMMGPDCYILEVNHRFDNINIPMALQGLSEKKITHIDNDVWIGRNVFMTPGRHIKTGSIVAAYCVLCKDFPEYSIIGGNPSKLIRNRKIME